MKKVRYPKGRWILQPPKDGEGKYIGRQLVAIGATPSELYRVWGGCLSMSRLWLLSDSLKKGVKLLPRIRRATRVEVRGAHAMYEKIQFSNRAMVAWAMWPSNLIDTTETALETFS